MVAAFQMFFFGKRKEVLTFAYSLFMITMLILIDQKYVNLNTSLVLALDLDLVKF